MSLPSFCCQIRYGSDRYSDTKVKIKKKSKFQTISFPRFPNIAQQEHFYPYYEVYVCLFLHNFIVVGVINDVTDSHDSAAGAE